MALPLALLAVAAGAQVAGGLMNGLEQRRNLQAQAAESQRQALEIERVGREEATQIRRAGRSVLGEATAQIAGSGFRVDSGSADDIRQYISQNAAQDAMNTILGAGEQAFAARTQATEQRRQSRSALMGGIFGGISGAVSTISGFRG